MKGILSADDIDKKVNTPRVPLMYERYFFCGRSLACINSQSQFVFNYVIIYLFFICPQMWTPCSYMSSCRYTLVLVPVPYPTKVCILD